MKDRKPRLTRDGLPVDPREWTVTDWKDLHEAVEKVRRLIAARHRPKGTHEPARQK